ncbi:LemA family protein [Pseudomonas sp. MYb185]|uniref:LemA family protein n=1 Tax=Pseudomonas sp. MYb185 TaxID=1848729 RepID=UPI000CFE0D1F|nr:LemA family protein [Pseudomonas sp. MYb185]PRB83774.1 LemA family protein [Pseudomonas sp. MYb185]
MDWSDVTGFVLVAALVVLLIYGITLYNQLVNLKHGVSRAWANIDVLLRQRHEELPKLVEACRQYMQYEQATLERVISARNAVGQARDRSDLKQLGQAETALRSGLGQLFALAENYPQLQANSSFQHLQQRISGLESGIADRRELYNAAVNINNVRIEQFPDVLVARLFSFRPAELLQFSEAEKADVNLRQLFS